MVGASRRLQCGRSRLSYIYYGPTFAIWPFRRPEIMGFFFGSQRMQRPTRSKPQICTPRPKNGKNTRRDSRMKGRRSLRRPPRFRSIPTGRPANRVRSPPKPGTRPAGLARFRRDRGRPASFPASDLSFAGAASDEVVPYLSSGSQRPACASAGDAPKRTQLLTVRGTAMCATSAARLAAIAGREPVRVRCAWLPFGTCSRDWAFGAPSAFPVSAVGGCLGSSRRPPLEHVRSLTVDAGRAVLSYPAGHRPARFTHAASLLPVRHTGPVHCDTSDAKSPD